MTALLLLFSLSLSHQIFYPDLINKSQAPTYTVTPIKDNPDFAVLQFHAGPPYEVKTHTSCLKSSLD